LTGQRFIRVWYVLHSNAIELAFIDVRHPVVFTPLVSGDRGFQIIAESIVGKSINTTIISINDVDTFYE